MPQLFVDADKIARARDLARSAANGVQALIDRHTTVSIERTVLRLLGITGAGARGAPLANLMVDRLRDAGVLNKGAAYWLGRALKASPGKVGSEEVTAAGSVITGSSRGSRGGGRGAGASSDTSTGHERRDVVPED